MTVESISLNDGKYVLFKDDSTGQMWASRNGEPWNRSLIGDNLVYWMMVRIIELEEQVKQKGPAP